MAQVLGAPGRRPGAETGPVRSPALCPWGLAQPGATGGCAI